MIYFDNAATTFCTQKVSEALSHFYRMPHGNPSAVHKLGFESSQILKRAHEFFASYFSVKPEQVIFTASGTEANNLALSGILKKKRNEGRNILFISPIEHSSVLKTAEAWGKNGFQIEFLKMNDQGIVDVEDLSKRLNSKVMLVAVMAVNNELGTIEPIPEIGKQIKEKDSQILFHVDAVQAFGKIPIQFKNWDVDLMSLSSHKIHGPVGAGALIVKEGVVLEPILYGGGQEQGIRSGTESVGMIHGFHVAAQEILHHQEASYGRVKNLKEKFKRGIEAFSCQKRFNTPDQSSPYILNVSFVGFPSEVMLRMLEEVGVLTSSGSSCNMKRKRPSSVLSAIGCNEEEQFSAIRFSFSPYTTETEIDQALEGLSQVLKRLEKVKV